LCDLHWENKLEIAAVDRRRVPQIGLHFKFSDADRNVIFGLAAMK
jgi:hypothetical protein